MSSLRVTSFRCSWLTTLSCPRARLASLVPAPTAAIDLLQGIRHLLVLGHLLARAAYLVLPLLKVIVGVSIIGRGVIVTARATGSSMQQLLSLSALATLVIVHHSYSDLFLSEGLFKVSKL